MDNILLCSTDAGGAHNIAPLLKEVIKRGYKPVLVTSKDMLHLFNLSDTNVIQSESYDKSLESAEDLINSVHPKAIICGTTRYVSIDRYLIAAGKKSEIRTVAVLDEWYNYRVRFEDRKRDLVFLPDAIACMDERAKEGATKEGIPEELCFVTGSPSLAKLTDHAEGFINNYYELPKLLESNEPAPVFTFLSQTLSSDFGTKKGESGPLGPYRGYTEQTVKEDILNVIKKIDKPCIVIEKLHPSTDSEDSDVIYNNKIKWVKTKKIDLDSLFWHSKAIIGMSSMALLEARIFNRPTISYQPGLAVKDTCTAVSFGLVDKLSTPKELEEWIEDQFEKPDEQEKKINRYPFARKDAAENVVSLALREA